jgi:hypothetical protein
LFHGGTKPTKLGDRYRLDELTFADTSATGGNAPIAVFAGG